MTSNNILKPYEDLIFPSGYEVSLMNMPLVDHDYSQFISKEYDTIIQKLDNLYFAAKYPEELDYVFSRYFRRIERLLNDLDDTIYSSVIDEIISPAPNDLSEVFFINHYELFKAVYGIYCVFRRDYSDVIELGEKMNLKAKLVPYYSLKEMHKEFLPLYSSEENIIDFYGIKIEMTAERKEKIEEQIAKEEHRKSETKNWEEPKAVINKLNMMFESAYDSYFANFDRYLEWSVSKKERELTYKALRFIQEKLENEETFFENKFLDYILFLAHTNIGGDLTEGAIIDYFTDTNFTVEEAKLFIELLEDIRLNKLYYEFDLQKIKEINEPIRYSMIDAVKEIEKKVSVKLTVKPLSLKISLANFASIISLFDNMGLFENTQLEIGNAFASILYNGRGEVAGNQTFIANMRKNTASQMKFLENFKEDIQVQIDEKLK